MEFLVNIANFIKATILKDICERLVLEAEKFRNERLK